MAERVDALTPPWGRPGGRSPDGTTTEGYGLFRESARDGHDEVWWLYSERRATSGSILAALRAGSQHASAATEARRTVTAVNVRTSIPLTP